MKKASNLREVFKRLMVFISTSPLLSLLILLLNFALLILMVFDGALDRVLMAFNGFMLALLLCFADFNTMKSPLQNARLQALKREILDAERKERQGQDH